jgi:flavin reductase (DIM6/NTAB) family NADH-FMN oxidoreductase RutF
MLPLELCRRLTNGLYVVGVAHGEQRDGFTAAWLTQVSFDPLLLALSINPSHASFPILVAAEAFAVSILGHGQVELARHFGTQSGWAAYLECRLVGRHPAGDHELVLGQVVGGRLLAPDALPMTYAETGNLDGSAGLYPSTFERGEP